MVPHFMFLVIGDQFGAMDLVDVYHRNGYVCGSIAGLSSFDSDASESDNHSKILAYPTPISYFVNIAWGYDIHG